MFPRAVFDQRQISLCRPAGPWMRCAAMFGARAMRSPCALASPYGWQGVVLASACQQAGIIAFRKLTMRRASSVWRRRAGKWMPNSSILHLLASVWHLPACSPGKIPAIMRRRLMILALPFVWGQLFSHPRSAHFRHFWYSADLTEVA